MRVCLEICRGLYSHVRSQLLFHLAILRYRFWQKLDGEAILVCNMFTSAPRYSLKCWKISYSLFERMSLTLVHILTCQICSFVQNQVTVLWWIFQILDRLPEHNMLTLSAGCYCNDDKFTGWIIMIMLWSCFLIKVNSCMLACIEGQLQYCLRSIIYILLIYIYIYLYILYIYYTYV